jgi:hypothetical protein
MSLPMNRTGRLDVRRRTDSTSALFNWTAIRLFWKERTIEGVTVSGRTVNNLRIGVN